MRDINEAKRPAVTLEHAQKRARKFLFGIHSSALEGITYSKEFVGKTHKLYLDITLSDQDCYDIAIHWEP